MGARGSSSGIGAGSSKSPQALVITDMGGVDVKDMNGRTFSDLKKFAQKQGYQVKEYTSKDLKKWDENHKADREATNKFLNEQDGTTHPYRAVLSDFRRNRRR